MTNEYQSQYITENEQFLARGLISVHLWARQHRTYAGAKTFSWLLLPISTAHKLGVSITPLNNWHARLFVNRE